MYENVGGNEMAELNTLSENEPNAAQSKSVVCANIKHN